MMLRNGMRVSMGLVDDILLVVFVMVDITASCLMISDMVTG